MVTLKFLPVEPVDICRFCTDMAVWDCEAHSKYRLIDTKPLCQQCREKIEEDLKD